MKYLGNLTEDQVIDFHFSTHKSDGTPITLGGTPVVKVYKANATGTETATGVTLDVDFDSVTGLHHVRIDTSADAFYAVANDYSVVITTGTVDSISVVGTVLATFSIENRYNEADVVKVSGDSTAADNLEAAYDGTGYAGGTIKPLVVLADAAHGGSSATLELLTTNFGTIASPDIGSLVWNHLTTGAITVDSYGQMVQFIYADTNELQTDWHDGGRLDLLLDAAVSNAGTGARTVAVTVNDGTDVLESASVRLTKGAETYVQTTNVSGQCTFNVDDGTWTVAITLHGYEFAGDSLVVDGDETATYSMTETAISAPASPSCATGYILCIGTDGAAESGVTITAQLVTGTGTAGYALDDGAITMTSDVNGLAQHTGFIRGAQYQFKRGTSAWTLPRTAPNAASWSLAEIVGST